MEHDKSICLVTNEFEGIDINGGIGTYYRELAILLSKNGWNVTILYIIVKAKQQSILDINKYAKFFYLEHGIPIYTAQDICNNFKDKSSNILLKLDQLYINEYWLGHSHVAHEALQILIKDYNLNFDLIEFPECCALGIIPIRMGKIFGDYNDSRIIVKLHSPSLWIAESLFYASLTQFEIKLDYLERYSFENADIQVSPTQYLLGWSRDRGWRVKDSASICRYPVSLNIACNYPESWGDRDKIVFFGRLEGRKGIHEFIEALRYIKQIDPAFVQRYSIIFLGRVSDISKEFIKNNLADYRCEFYRFNRRDAIKFLKEAAKLVVIPSYQDNYPNTVIECMCEGIPFITSRGGGIPEMIGIDSELYSSISCDVSDPMTFGNLILKYLNLDKDTLYTFLNLANQRVKSITNPKDILKWYDEQLTNNGKSSKISNEIINEAPGVTIIIPTFNETTEKYLDKTIISLLNQTYKNICIIINDASTDPGAILKLNYLIKKYSEHTNIKIIHQNHNGIANALNQILPYVDTKYVMEVDGDNLSLPEMVETFVHGMENREDISALSCYNMWFYDNDECKILEAMHNGIHARDISNKCMITPVGPCLPCIFFENTIGDANSIYLTKVVKQLGGWPDDKLGFQDWAMWIKMIANGFAIDVIPKFLYYYRDRQLSDAKSKKLINVDNNNLKFVRIFIQNNPDYFYQSCYESLQRLIRLNYPYGSNVDYRPKDFSELDSAKQELQVIKSSALYAVGVKLGNLSKRSIMIKKFFELAGKFAKNILTLL